MNDWTLEQFANHYAETMRSAPNAWGAHLSPIYGASHHIMNAARNRWPDHEVDAAFRAAIYGNNPKASQLIRDISTQNWILELSNDPKQKRRIKDRIDRMENELAALANEERKP